jgi:CBS domain-containing protein
MLPIKEDQRMKFRSSTTVRDVMTAQVVTGRPDDSVQEIARIMSEIDTGAVPICRGTEVVGLVTDRDIVLRVVAEGRDLDTPISEVMTEGVKTCGEDEPIEDAARRMAELQMRRLIVLTGDGRLAGILSLGDVAVEHRSKEVGRVLEEISDPGDQPAT